MVLKGKTCAILALTLLLTVSCSNGNTSSSFENSSPISNSTSEVISSESSSPISSELTSDLISSEELSSEISSEEISSEEESSESISSEEISSEETSSEEISSELSSGEISSEEESSESISSEEISSEEPSSEAPSVHICTFPDEWVIDKPANDFEKGKKHRDCTGCGERESAIIDYTLDFPRVHINYKDIHPSAPDATNYNGFANWTWEYLTVPFRYEAQKGEEHRNFQSFAKMRIQGGTSKNSSYLKKNYAIKLYEDRDCTVKNKVTLVDSWGDEHKYVLKANWIDATHSRNLATASIWSDVVGSRATSQYVSPRENVDLMINNGAVDGYPVMLYFNNEYFGLYTLNIPKDKWLFGMKKSNTQGLLFAEGTAKKSNGSLYESTGFKELMEWDNTTMSGSGWEVEYAYDETDTKWMADSMNEAISVVMNTYGKLKDSMSLAEKQAIRNQFREQIPNHLDIDGCIDYMIFLHCIQGFPDNSTKNVIWSTYDGKIWSPNAYDLDTTWNLSWDGKIGDFNGNPLSHETGGFWINGWYRANLRGNALFEAILLFYAEEVQNRYNELRAENAPLSNENITSTFTAFVNQIPSSLYEKDAEMYPTIPSVGKTDLNQILTFANKLLAFMDGEYNGEKMEHNKNYFSN